MILVVLVGWQEPKYTSFITRTGKCYTTRYESLWQAKDKKTQQENNTMFSMLLEEIQQCTANIWCILKGSCIGKRGDCKVQGILKPYMDPSYEGSQACMVEDVVLCDQGGGGVGHQRLACVVEITNNQTHHQDKYDATAKPKDTSEACSSP
jgi:hypothetical protein